SRLRVRIRSPSSILIPSRIRTFLAAVLRPLPTSSRIAASPLCSAPSRGPPFVLRLYGRGEGLEPNDSKFNELNKRFALDLGVRSIIRVGLTRIQDSCGFDVPLYDFVKPRDMLLKWAEKKGEQGIVKFKREHNVRSIDGLLALEVFDRPQ